MKFNGACPKQIGAILTNLVGLLITPERRGNGQFPSVKPYYHDVTIRSSNLLVKKFEQVVDQHCHDHSFDLRQMAVAMDMSERQLQRKLQLLTGRTPSQYVRSFRLSKSLEYLLVGCSVRDTAKAVGFSSQAYFASCFKAQYGRTPTQYQHRHM